MKVYSHIDNLKQIGHHSVCHLSPEKTPPQPFIYMTGEHYFPKQWDYFWSVAKHFNKDEGIYCPVYEDSIESVVSRKLTPPGHKHIQSFYKFRDFAIDLIQPVLNPNIDGMIVTEKMDNMLISKWLKKIHRSRELLLFANEAHQNGYEINALRSFYCYAPQPASTVKHAVPAPIKSNTLTPLVSVIIPNYDRSDTLSNAIESVLLQTYKNIDVLVVNDAGNDTRDIVTKIANR